MMAYGEEGTHFGSAAALHDEDMVYAQYRELGQSACAVPPLVPLTSNHTLRCSDVAWLHPGPGDGPVLQQQT